MMKIHIKSVFVRVAFDSMLLSIICKMQHTLQKIVLDCEARPAAFFHCVRNMYCRRVV